MSAVSLPQRGALACLVAVALLATACGGGSSSSGATGSAAGATGAKAAAGATPDAPAPTTTKVVAKGGGQFCKDIATVANDPSGAASADTAAGEKAQATKSLGELKVLEAEAPSSIKSDIKTLADSLTTFYAALAKADYDPTKLDPAAETALQAAPVTAAETKLEAYSKNTCGINVGASGSATAAPAAPSS